MQAPFEFFEQGHGRQATEMVFLSHSIPPFIQYYFLTLGIWYFWGLVILNYDLKAKEQCDPLLLPDTHIHTHLYIASSDISGRQ